MATTVAVASGRCAPGSNKRPLKHCDLYVVRLLPAGRMLQGSATRDETPARLGLSQPCVRCLRALAAFGVHRVIFSTGEAGAEGEVGFAVREVRELLEEAGERGHYSRGDRCAAEAGVLPGENKNCLPHAAMRGWAERVPRGGVRA